MWVTKCIFIVPRYVRIALRGSFLCCCSTVTGLPCIYQGSGGCCDCGDSEAWCPAGNCSLHGVKEDAVPDPLLAMPAQLARGLRAVLVGVVGVIVSSSAAIARGFIRFDQNEYIAWVDSFNAALTLRLHNDDTHSFDDVIRALVEVGIPEHQVWKD
jgi:hypothetical protein